MGKIAFNKIFGKALAYPFSRKDVLLVFFLVNLIFSFLGWYITNTMFNLSDFSLTTEKFIEFIFYVLPINIIGWIFWIFLMPMYLENSIHFYKGKRKPLFESFEASKKRFLPVLGIFIIFGLLILACFGGFLLVIYAVISGSDLTLIGLAGLWFIIGSVIGVVLMFFFFLSPVVCVFEKARSLESFKKSFQLVSKNKLSTSLFFIIIILMFFAISIIGSIPELIYGFFVGLPTPLSISDLSFMIIRTFVTSYLGLFFYASFAFYYLNLKRKI
jgi:hypothetical protein